jgi:hypothetical protein
MIHNFSSYVGEVGWTLKTMPNGDICFLFCDDHEWVSHNGTDIWRNTDNGTEGNWAYCGNFSEFGQCYVYDWMVYNNTVYAYINDPHIFSGCSSYIAYSDDSGYTWTKLGNSIGSFGGEWSAIPTNESASNWTTINRFTSTGAGPSGSSSCGANGPGDNYAPWLEQYTTDDSCVTWSDLDTNCPDECNDAVQESNQENKGNQLWWLDDEVIVAQCEYGNTPNAKAAFWINDNNMNKNDWSDHTDLGNEGAAAPRNAYSRGCALPKRAGTLGGWGYMVWSEEGNQYVKGIWVANNDTLSWTWPPGPSDSEYYVVSFATNGDNLDTLTTSEAVSFYDTSTVNDNKTAWSWDFGDGTTSTDKNPTHTYTYPGRYTVSLTVTYGGDGDTTGQETVDIGSVATSGASTDYIVWLGVNQTLTSVKSDLGASGSIYFYNTSDAAWDDEGSETINTFDIIKTGETLSTEIDPNTDVNYTKSRSVVLNEGGNYTAWSSNTADTIKGVATDASLEVPSFVSVWDGSEWDAWIPGFTPDALDVSLSLYDVLYIAIGSTDDPATIDIP